MLYSNNEDFLKPYNKLSTKPLLTQFYSNICHHQATMSNDQASALLEKVQCSFWVWAQPMKEDIVNDSWSWPSLVFSSEVIFLNNWWHLPEYLKCWEILQSHQLWTVFEENNLKLLMPKETSVWTHM